MKWYIKITFYYFFDLFAILHNWTQFLTEIIFKYLLTMLEWYQVPIKVYQAQAVHQDHSLMKTFRQISYNFYKVQIIKFFPFILYF